MKLTEMLAELTKEHGIKPIRKAELTAYINRHNPILLGIMQSVWGPHTTGAFHAGMNLMLVIVSKYGLPDDLEELFDKETGQ